MSAEEDKQFERDVRRVAELLWPGARIAGSIMIDGREHDGVYETEECVHLIECTTTLAKKKALDDSRKLTGIAEKLRKQKPDKAVKSWFVTRGDPSADQKQVCVQHNVVAQSFHQFQGRIVNANDYLGLRQKHSFGSAYDPRNDSYTENFDYVEIDLLESISGVGRSVKDLSRSVIGGGRFVLLGDYGVGKSMTLREMFFRLTDGYSRVKNPSFPIYLNLREHHGQSDPAEILERHGRAIGFANPSHLVRAWKAGYGMLLLDGFDEVSSLGLQGGWKRLREARHSSMEGVRRLVRDTPKTSGIVLAGRDTFFDTDIERREALQCKDFSDIRLGEFTEKQIEKFLLQLGYSGKVPSWMPSRPLLLSTLFSKGVRTGTSDELNALLESQDASMGWDLLLKELCDREARIEAGLSGQTIRQILENLATRARGKSNGLGPISPREMAETFIDVCQYEPADQSLIVLQRLPGMGKDTSGEGDARTFVDSDLADACRAGDLTRFVINPYEFEKVNQLCEARLRVCEIGLGIAASVLNSQSLDRSASALKSALKMAEKLPNAGSLVADLVLLSWRSGFETLMAAQIRNVTFETMRFLEDSPNASGVEFDNCYFSRIEIDTNVEAAKLPRFVNCLVLEIDGRVSKRDLPQDKFINCEIDGFLEGTLTNDSIRVLPVPIGVKVMLTLLKKLFVQSLSGRQEGALFRGLDNNVKSIVLQVLEILSQHNIVTRSGRAGDPIWLPVRRQMRRVMQMMEAPSVSDDVVIIEARRIS